jgi:hypothetical protein
MRLNAKKNHKRVSYRIFICDRDFLVYINFNFDFLDIHNEFFESYFANELTRIKTFAVPTCRANDMHDAKYKSRL